MIKRKDRSIYFRIHKHYNVLDNQVRYLLSLVDAPKEVKELVEEEKLPPSIAGEIDINFI